MNQFITFREPLNDKLEYYILQRAFPHFVGRISNYPIENAIANAPVAGYNLWVTFAGTIMGNMIPNYRHIQSEITLVYENMAVWFLSERINANPKRYEKLKMK